MCEGGGADVVGVEGGGGGWCVYGVERVCSGLRGLGGLMCVGVEWVWSGLRGVLVCVGGGAGVVGLRGVEAGVGVCRGWSGCGRG